MAEKTTSEMDIEALQERLRRSTTPNGAQPEIAVGDLPSAARKVVLGTNPKDLIGMTKPPLHLVPAVAIIHESMAFKDGARKYGGFNWRAKAVKASVYVAAAKRHIDEWFDGEEKAKDSGVHHLAHARACLAILLDAASLEQLEDDRPLPGKAAELIDQLTEKKAPAAVTPNQP